METSETRSLGRVALIRGAARDNGLAGFTDNSRESYVRLFSINVNAVVPVVVDGEHWAGWMLIRSCGKSASR